MAVHNSFLMQRHTAFWPLPASSQLTHLQSDSKLQPCTSAPLALPGAPDQADQPMGGATSRAVARPAAEAAAVAQAAARSGAPKGVVADIQRAAQQPEPQRTESVKFEDEERMEAKDTSLDGFLNKLGGSIHGKQVDISPKEGLRAATRRVAFVDDYAGRLPPDALKQLFALQEHAAGEPPDVEALVKKYRVDAAAVEKVLRYSCLPAVVEAKGAAGVQAFADWPEWFRRRQHSGES